MARSSKLIAGIAVIGAVAAGLYVGFGRSTRSGGSVPPLVATQRTEPETFNRLVTGSAGVDSITHLLHAPLIKVDRVSGELLPWLAERWESPTPNSYRLHLRRGVKFSDGHGFSAADVVFTFRALYDSRVNSVLASGLRIGGKPLLVTAEDDHTILIEFPDAYGPGLAILDVLPILPRHRLEQPLNEGRFAQAWVTSAPLDTVAGLGPFVVTEVKAGESLTFSRNPHYFRAGHPQTDRIIIRIVPDQSAEIVQLESGAADMVTSGLRAEDVASFRALERQGRISLHDVGVGLDPNALWFNLKPGAEPAKGRQWLQSREWRHAISRGVNRQRIVDTVFLGAGAPVIAPVTPGHGAWHAADVVPPPHDAAEAAKLLDSIGLTDRNGDGVREDPRGQPVRFALLTQRGNTTRERTAAIIQEDLRKIGIAVDLVPLETGALIARIGSGNYDAVFFGVQASGIDPAVNLDYWLPSGSFHFWNPAQPTPANDWERELERLMQDVVRLTDQDQRHRAFHEVQRLFARELPAIYFAAPRVVVPTSRRVEGVRPSMLLPHILWNPETLRVSR